MAPTGASLALASIAFDARLSCVAMILDAQVKASRLVEMLRWRLVLYRAKSK